MPSMELTSLMRDLCPGSDFCTGSWGGASETASSQTTATAIHHQNSRLARSGVTRLHLCSFVFSTTAVCVVIKGLFNLQKTTSFSSKRTSGLERYVESFTIPLPVTSSSRSVMAVESTWFW